jgi:hypothetical protein
LDLLIRGFLFPGARFPRECQRNPHAPTGPRCRRLLCGTRFVDYLTVRRFDEFDRSPEALAAHVQDAMRQLWTANTF